MKLYFSVFFLIVFLCTIFFFLLPTLVSAASTFANIIALVLFMIVLPVTYIWVKKIIGLFKGDCVND